MANALSRLSNSLFGSREDSQRPTPGMLGTGLASNAASSALKNEYLTHVKLAEASGDEIPTFEEWVLQRR